MVLSLEQPKWCLQINNMKVIPFLIIMLAGSFCNNSQPKKISFEILNNTRADIDSIRIIGVGLKDTVQNVRSMKRIERDLILDHKGNHEGGFGLAIYVRDSLVGGGQFGYYENPSFVKSIYKLEIQEGFIVREVN
jgi:hypothetical protein